MPSDWRALQRDVARVLIECGFGVTIEKTLDLVRGSSEIDVYAEEVRENRTLTVFCECKHWRSNVPQTVVHAFRTVVSDGGADTGYLIASSGFQKGAIQAAASSNVRLVTWRAFQEEFEPTWITNHLRPTVARRLDALLTYTEPVNSAAFRSFELLSDSEKRKFVGLRRRYTPFGAFMMQLTPYVAVLNNGKAPILPLSPPTQLDLHESQFPAGFFEVTGYADLLDIALPFGEKATEELRSVLKSNRNPDWDPRKA